MLRIVILAVSVLSVSVTASTFADGIPIKPGKWEMNSTVKAPTMPEPTLSTMMQCLTEDQLSPEAMASEGLPENCTMKATQIDGDTMTWGMNCPIGATEMVGTWKATSTGKTISGQGEVTSSFNGQKFKMEMSWEGRYIGDCD